MYRVILTLLALSLGSMPALAQAPEASWVLPPGSEAEVRKAFDGQTLGGWRYDGAQIRKDHVGLAFKRGGVWTEALLVHGSTVPGPGAGGSTVVVGRAAPALRRAISKRLAKSGARLPWQKVVPAPPPVVIEQATEVEGQRREDDGEAIVTLGDQIEHLIARGDLDIAKKRLAEAKITDIRSEAARADWAALHAMVGEVEQAKNMARALSGTRAEPVVRVLLEEPVDVANLLSTRVAGERCSLTQAGRILRRLERYDEAKALLSALAEQEPDCLRAVLELALIHVHFQDGAATLALLEGGLAKHPGDHQLMMMKVSALRLLGRQVEAVSVMENIVRGEHRQAGNLGMLLAMYLRGQQTEQAIETWKAWHVDHPDDVVAPFMVGVLLHYGNHFEESNRWLEPLEDRLHDEPRIFVYRAMNAFNLGDRATARTLLDAAALLPVVDPDVYYCRAEITRDTERELAIEDLGRYLALTEGTPHASVEKQARVRDMYEELLVCHRENHAHCAGPWEHPRKAWWETPKAAGLVGLAGLLIVGLALRRRRHRMGRTGEGAP